MNRARSSPSLRLASGKVRIVAAVLFVGLICFLAFAHPFLALNQPVKADILVVEGWVPDHVILAAANEFKQGAYTRVFVSGFIQSASTAEVAERSDPTRAHRLLEQYGVNTTAIELCPAPETSFNRTSHMARAVRDRMTTLGVQPRGVNVVTMGPHARQTLLAYRRMVAEPIPVGVITVPTNTYNPSFWWVSPAGIVKTTKDFAGWLKEVMFGLRS